MTPEAVNDYLPVLIMAIWGIVFAAGGLGVSFLLGEKGRENPVKNTPYECGLPIESHAHARFSVKFFVVAILFIVFDVEAVLMFPWAVAFGAKEVARATYPGTALLLFEALAFVLVLLCGWVYVVKKGVLEWHTEE